VTVQDKEGISEETLDTESLKTPRHVKRNFKVGSRVSGMMCIVVYFSENYVSVTASAGSQIYVDQRKVEKHFNAEKLRDIFKINLYEDDTDNEMEDEW